MKNVCIVLRRPPYGTVDTSEAVRHALGGVVEEMEVRLVLLDGGVHAARHGQSTEGTEFDSVGEGVADCRDMGVEVYVDKGSLSEQGIGVEDLIEGLKVLDGPGIAGIISESGTTMIF
jgi:sulfur relay (sulfurtransferase) DsrF/TusC family protein